ncbi:MAG: hypothetical protein ACREJT_09085, partial [Myxococcota bacterium]
MPTWNFFRPSDIEPWNQGDGRIRDNFEYLQVFLQLISTFNQNPGDPTQRASIRLSAGANLAARPVTALASETGRVYFTLDTKRLYICIDGAVNAWSEISELGAVATGALTAASLAVAGGATLNGGIFLTGGIVSTGGIISHAAIGAKISVPPGENWLVVPGDSMSPHHHQLRHRPGSLDGLWTTPNDMIYGGLQRVLSSATVLSAAVEEATAIAAQTLAGHAHIRVPFSMAARPGLSHAMVHCELLV